MIMLLLLAAVGALAYWLGAHRRADDDPAGWQPWLLAAGAVLGVILLASLLTGGPGLIGGPGPLWGPGPIFGP